MNNNCDMCGQPLNAAPDLLAKVSQLTKWKEDALRTLEEDGVMVGKYRDAVEVLNNHLLKEQAKVSEFQKENEELKRALQNVNILLEDGTKALQWQSSELERKDAECRKAVSIVNDHRKNDLFEMHQELYAFNEQNKKLKEALQGLLNNMPNLISELPVSALDPLDIPVREAIIKAKELLKD